MELANKNLPHTELTTAENQEETYVTPHLIVYGDVVDLTQCVGTGPIDLNQGTQSACV